jgi:hypothetical protein
MSTIKCFNCGVTNWASAETCVRCKNKLEYYADEDTSYPQSQSDWKANSPAAYESTANSNSFLRSPIAIICLIVFGLFGFYFAFLRSSPQNSAKMAATDSSKPAEIAVAAPPAGMNVTPPDISNFKTLVQNEINQSHTNEFSTEKTAPSSEPYNSNINMNASMENYEKVQQEARKKLGPCDVTINDCQQLLAQRKNEMIREQNQREEFFGSSRMVKCPPQVQGEIKPVEPGTYHKFDDQIYYVTKVLADGMEGVEENGQCSYKPAIAGLTAQIYLKWQGAAYGLSGWQASSKLEMQNVSLAFQKKKKEAAAEKREKAKNPSSGIF